MHRLLDLLVCETLTAKGGAPIPEDGSDAGLGDAVAIADLLDGFASFIPLHDIGDVFGG